MTLVRYYPDNRVDVTEKQHNMVVMEVHPVLHMVANQLATQRDIQCRVTNRAIPHQVICQCRIQATHKLVQVISKDKTSLNQIVTVHFANFPKQNISSTANASILWKISQIISNMQHKHAHH